MSLHHGRFEGYGKQNRAYEKRQLRSAGFAFLGAMLIGDGYDLVQATYDLFGEGELVPPKPPWCSRCGSGLGIYRWCSQCGINDNPGGVK